MALALYQGALTRSKANTAGITLGTTGTANPMLISFMGPYNLWALIIHEPL